MTHTPDDKVAPTSEGSITGGEFLAFARQTFAALDDQRPHLDRLGADIRAVMLSAMAAEPITNSPCHAEIPVTIYGGNRASGPDADIYDCAKRKFGEALEAVLVKLAPRPAVFDYRVEPECSLTYSTARGWQLRLYTRFAYSPSGLGS